jgi:large subunit ribosomal protein L22
MKRMRPRARGRSARILKPFAQITVVLRQVEEPA